VTHLFRDQGLLRESIFEPLPDVYQITFHATNVLLIVEPEMTLIDAGFRSGVPRILDFIAGLGRRPEDLRLIILTHNHVDHIGGLRELVKRTGARVACHRADIYDIEGHMPYPRTVDRALQTRALATLRPRFSVSSVEVNVRLEGGEVLSPLGGLAVVHVPGHTPGSVCLYSESCRLLVVGDALVRRNLAVYFPHGTVSTDRPLAIQSAQKLASLAFDKICFGHGPPLTRDAHALLLACLARPRS